MENLQEFRSQLNDIDGRAVELADDLQAECINDELSEQLIDALQTVANLITEIQEAQKWI